MDLLWISALFHCFQEDSHLITFFEPFNGFVLVTHRHLTPSLVLCRGWFECTFLEFLQLF
jgi:hypothetical protein